MARRNRDGGKRKKMGGRVRDRAERRKSEGSGSSTLAIPEGVERWRPEEKGTVQMDIIPYVVSAKNHPEVKAGELWYQRTYWVHMNVGPEDLWFICPKKTMGKPCPICEEYNRVRKDENADEDEVKALRPKERELYNVIILSSKDKGEDDIQLFDFSYHLFGKQLEAELRDEESGDENASFPELEGGKTIKVRFAKKKLGKSEFLEADRFDFVDRDDYDEDILDKVVDLDTVLKVPSYEQLQKAFLGMDEEPDDDDDGDDDDGDEDEPKSKRKSSRRSKRSRDEDDDDDDSGDDDSGDDDGDDDDGDDDGGDAKECPACEGSGKSSKGKKCVPCNGTGELQDEDDDGDDDDDDGDDDSDDADDEPPAKSRRKKSSSKKSSKSKKDEDDDDDFEDDDNWDDDGDDDDDDGDDDGDEDDDPPPAKKKSSRRRRK